MERTHLTKSICIWSVKELLSWQWSKYRTMKLNTNNRFDLETWNLQGQGHRQRSQWVELIKVYLHVKFERGIVNGHSAMNLNARAKPNCWRRWTDGTIHRSDFALQSGQKGVYMVQKCKLPTYVDKFFVGQGTVYCSFMKINKGHQFSNTATFHLFGLNPQL